MNETRTDFLDLATRRHSVRAYSARPVDRAIIDRCLEAARLAPSACNSQPWTFIVIDDPVLREALASAAGGGMLPLNHFTRQAPVLVAVVAERANMSARVGSRVKDKPFAMMDVAIAAEHFCLQAADEGLGTCMLGWFDEPRVRSLLDIPSTARPALMLTLGYPDHHSGAAKRRRKPMEQISAWNRYPQTQSAKASAPVSGRRSVAGLILWLAVTYLAAVIGGAATARAGAFYADLTRPPWAPPGWLFGPVWSLLYTLMGIAAWQVWRTRGWRAARGPLCLYLAHLGVNAVWSWLFFAWRMGAVAFGWILLLMAMVFAMIRTFRRIRPATAWLLWPYLAWLIFAAALAFYVWQRNPGLL